MSRITKIDEKLSLRPHGTRVFYFVSEERDIITDVMNESAVMQSILGGSFKKLKEGDRIKYSTGGLEENSVVIVRDFQHKDEMERAQIIIDVLDSEKNVYLLISSPLKLLPTGLEDEVLLCEVGYLDREDIGKIWKIDDERKVKKLLGMTKKQIETILKNSAESIIGSEEERYEIFLRRVRAARQDAATKDAAMSMREVDAKKKTVGMGNYENWIDKKKYAFLNPEDALREWGKKSIKGVVFIGVPGTGKTAMALASAVKLSENEEEPLPVIELRLEEIDSSRYGESTARLKRYLKKAEAMAPCILLIDEVEKSFAKNNSTHEVRVQQIGILLQWLQGRRENVYTFITANAVNGLPPEMLRDGRMSERFFVFLPTCDELADILVQKLTEIRENMGVDRYGLTEFKKTDAIELLNDIAEAAKERETAKLFTGANIEKIIDEAIDLWKEKTENNTFENKEKSAKERFIECLEKSAMRCVAQGQSDMENIIDIWFAAKEKQYVNVSDNNYFNFDKFVEILPDEEDDGKKTGNESKEEKYKRARCRFSNAENTLRSMAHEYDKWLFDCICYEIDKHQRSINEEKAIRTKMAEKK